MVKMENVQSSGITRRDFVKGLAIGAAGLGIATILPGGIITAASAADTTTKQQVGKQGDGIYIDGVAENMKSKTYTLEFVQPIKLVAVKDGKVQSEGTWRTTNKHLVSVDPGRNHHHAGRRGRLRCGDLLDIGGAPPMP